MAARSSSLSVMSTAATFSCRLAIRRVPGIGTMSVPWASTQARASWLGVTPLRSAMATTWSRTSRFLVKFSPWKRGELRRKSSVSKSSMLRIRPERKPRPRGEYGTKPMPSSPMVRGFLSGRRRSIDDFDTDDFRRSSPRFQGENFTKNLEVLDQVVAIAERKGVTPSQLALAWVLAQGTDIVPIPGTRRIANLQENVAAVDIDLSADDLAAIDQVTRPGWPPVSATPLLACRPSTAEPLTAQPSVQSIRD